MNNQQKIRYSRHIMLNEVGQTGQNRLQQSHVLVVGCGGLGSSALFYLAASGVGTLSFCDADCVELSNLQRQILFKINHLGQNKATAAGKVLASLNNQIQLNPHPARLDEHNAEALIKPCDLVLDCSDNFATRYLINRTCQRLGVGLVSGAAQQFQGQIMGFAFGEQPSPCYECVFAEPAQMPTTNCDTLGVISPLVGMVGSQQALLAINYLLKIQNGSHFSAINGRTLNQQVLRLNANPQCKVCASHK